MPDGQAQPKISLPEAIVVGGLLAVVDIVEFVPALFGLDLWIPDIIVTPAMQIYLWLKGVKWGYSLAGNIVEFFPFAGAAPLRIIPYLVTVWIDHHPAAARAVAVAPRRRSG